jgi:hypothetical protein
MKKLLLIMFLFISVFGVVSASTTDNFNFALVLNKQGTDSLWFSQSNVTSGARTNSYTFPIINATGTSSDKGSSVDLYLHWEKNSSRTITIRLSFVCNDGEENDDTKKYMMKGTTDSTNGLNYNVTATDGSGNTVFSIAFDTAKERVTPAISTSGTTTTDLRVKEFNPSSYTSPAKLAIVIKPASKLTSTTGGTTETTYSDYWGNEEQYVGYIKAEIWVS